MAEFLFALLHQLVDALTVGVGHLVLQLLHVLHPALHVLDHGGNDRTVAPHLALHRGNAVVQADDGPQAQQLARKSGGGADAAALLHLLQAEGRQADLIPGEHLLQLFFDRGNLGPVADLAGGLAHIPAKGHAVGAAVHKAHLQLVAGALVVQLAVGHHRVVVGGAAGGVDEHRQHLGVAGVHVFAEFLQKAQGGNGGGGGHALGGAHHVVEFIVGEILALGVADAVQRHGKAQDVNAVLLFQCLGNVRAGIGENGNFAHGDTPSVIW